MRSGLSACICAARGKGTVSPKRQPAISSTATKRRRGAPSRKKSVFPNRFHSVPSSRKVSKFIILERFWDMTRHPFVEEKNKPGIVDDDLKQKRKFFER